MHQLEYIEDTKHAGAKEVFELLNHKLASKEEKMQVEIWDWMINKSGWR